MSIVYVIIGVIVIKMVLIANQQIHFINKVTFYFIVIRRIKSIFISHETNRRTVACCRKVGRRRILFFLCYNYAVIIVAYKHFLSPN